jgi:hypothetical protein
VGAFVFVHAFQQLGCPLPLGCQLKRMLCRCCFAFAFKFTQTFAFAFGGFGLQSPLFGLAFFPFLLFALPLSFGFGCCCHRCCRCQPCGLQLLLLDHPRCVTQTRQPLLPKLH